MTSDRYFVIFRVSRTTTLTEDNQMAEVKLTYVTNGKHEKHWKATCADSNTPIWVDAFYSRYSESWCFKVTTLPKNYKYGMKIISFGKVIVDGTAISDITLPAPWGDRTLVLDMAKKMASAVYDHIIAKYGDNNNFRQYDHANGKID